MIVRDARRQVIDLGPTPAASSTRLSGSIAKPLPDSDSRNWAAIKRKQRERMDDAQRATVREADRLRYLRGKERAA